MTDSAERTRTISWHDPIQNAAAAMKLSGMEAMQAYLRGDIAPAPISLLMNFYLTEVDFGRAVFKGTPGEFHYNPIGVVHGGFAATLLDSALGCCIHTTLPAGVGYTTLELHVNLVRAISVETGLMTCEGKVIHAGKQIATAEAKLTDSSGKLYAHGTTTCLIFPLPT